MLSFCLTLILAAGLAAGANLPDYKALYEPGDKITLLNATDFKSVILGSPRAWLVEFYSSWCGHCIHYAPMFKELAQEVHPWRNVIGFGAIDCALEANLGICRDYEIMGYPSLKFFPPLARPDELGQLKEVGQKSVPALKQVMQDYVQELQLNETLHDTTKYWPILKEFTAADLSSLWTDRHVDYSSAPYAVVIVDSAYSRFATDVLFDLSNLTMHINPKLPLRRISRDDISAAVSSKLALEGRPPVGPHMFVVSRDLSAIKYLTPTVQGEISRGDYVKALSDFLATARDLQVGDGERKQVAPPPPPPPPPPAPPAPKQVNPKHHPLQMVHHESSIKRRRYTTYMADLENAVLYSLAHEVAQHATISGDKLNALQAYVDVLVCFFPGRSRAQRFLGELRAWVMRHEDAVLGEDLARQVEVLKTRLASFDDTPSAYIGCSGSEPRYGSYPCGLWMLWHVLTVRQSELAKDNDDDPAVVLKAMSGFVEQFFGCRECARHFNQESEDGKSIAKNVHTPGDAMLWLWRLHNRVNKRLSGDITDDEAFPKETFPNREHCSDCYNYKTGGSDLWSEFRLNRVKRFLREMYGASSLNMKGLKVMDRDDDIPVKAAAAQASHDLAPYSGGEGAGGRAGNGGKFAFEQRLDKRNFERSSNETWSIFSKADVSLCFSVYALSAIILVLGYYKFVAKRKFGSCLSAICPRSRSPDMYANPLVGKA